MYQCLLRLSFNLKQGMAVGEKGVILITVRNGLKHGIFATVAGSCLCVKLRRRLYADMLLILCSAYGQALIDQIDLISLNIISAVIVVVHLLLHIINLCRREGLFLVNDSCESIIIVGLNTEVRQLRYVPVQILTFEIQ